MNEYKLSAENKSQIKEFLFQVFNYEWNEVTQSAMLNNTDAFVFIGLIPEAINEETGEVLSYFSGLHFDLLSSLNITIPESFVIHNPITPKHRFA
jgi:hypothetical protein